MVHFSIVTHILLEILLQEFKVGWDQPEYKPESNPDNKKCLYMWSVTVGENSSCPHAS